MVEIISPVQKGVLERREKLDKRRKNFKKRAWKTTKSIVAIKLIALGTYGLYTYDANVQAKINELEDKIKSYESTTPIEYYVKDKEYDMDTRMVTDWMQLPNIVNATYKIHIEAEYTDIGRHNADGSPIKEITEGTGTGLLLEDGRILTADHVISPKKKYAPMFSPFKGVLTDTKLYIEINNEKYPIDVISAKLDNRDLGIAKVKDIPKTPRYDGKIGEYDELKRGNVMYSAGFGLNVGERLIIGSYGGIVEGSLGHEGRCHYVVGANPGDSGSPIFAIRDGEFELVGILTSKVIYGGHDADDMSMFEGLEKKLIK